MSRETNRLSRNATSANGQICNQEFQARLVFRFEIRKLMNKEMATSETSPTNANESLNATKQVTSESLESTLNANIKGLFGGFCLFGLLGLIIQQLRTWEMTDILWTAGDWMLLSCFLLVIAAALVARGLRNQYDRVITRLWQRGVLNLGDADRPVPHSLIQTVVEHSHQKASRYSLWGGLFFCSICLLYTSPSPRDRTRSRMPSSA